MGGDPQLALATGTFAPGSTTDNTGKGNTCDVDEADEGCIFTQNLLVDDATAAEISAAVLGVAATAVGSAASVGSATAVGSAASASTCTSRLLGFQECKTDILNVPAVAAASTGAASVCGTPTATVTATAVATAVYVPCSFSPQQQLTRAL